MTQSNLQSPLNLLQQSLAIHQELGDRPNEARALSDFGQLLAEQDQPELAITFLKQSVNLTEALRAELDGLPQDEQKIFAGAVSDRYRLLADLLLQQDRILEAQEVLDLLKLQELDDYLHDAPRSVNDTNTAPGLDFWPAEQAILDLYSQQLQTDSSFDFPNFINSSEIAEQVEQLRRNAKGQNLNPEQLARLQDNLQQAGNAALLYPLIQDDRIELVLVTTSGLVNQSVPVDRAELNEVIRAFRADITRPSSEPIANAQKLYQWIIAPIAEQLEQSGADTILYAADNTLRYIPLAALHDGEQWLTQRFTINHITAASLTNFSQSRATGLNILAGAFPTQDLQVDIDGEFVSFEGLPYAQKEVQNLADTITDTTALFSADFNRTALEPELNNHTIVHFATHAKFQSGYPADSYILLGDGDRITLFDLDEWQLTNVDLVVLSACETAVSAEALGNGEEILGFGYQIQQTGAEAAIATLWPVSDGGTQVLMNEFYNALNQGMGKAEALKLAQSALIAKDFTAAGNIRGDDGRIVAVSTATGISSAVSNNLDHPYYWAPFILIGNGL
ncbi:MAG: CHAT domain-containing protein [Thainema sp.]